MNEILPEIFEEAEVKHESVDRPMGASDKFAHPGGAGKSEMQFFTVGTCAETAVALLGPPQWARRSPERQKQHDRLDQIPYQNTSGPIHTG
ncbi:hypothetical protein [Pseudomonas asplenii]|uniref:hypothetical protein n=1 Tax=Pseudomonas asplenii TaxID=53407 RepID=UPI0012F96F2F|nr:hypothetical protein [Pseudomonas fuscovaginae]